MLSGKKLCGLPVLALGGMYLYLVAGAALAAGVVLGCGDVCWCLCTPSPLWVHPLALGSLLVAEMPSQG